MNHRSNPSTCPTGDSAKTAMLEEIKSGKAFGLIAFNENTPVGWCAIDPVRKQIGHDYYLQTEDAKSNGARELLAFPIPEDSGGKFPKDLAEFSGRYSTFKKFGFESKNRLDDFYQVVSKVL